MDTAEARPASTPYLGAATALVTIVTAEAIRVFVTLVYGFREEAGTVAAGSVAILVFLAPFAAAVLRRILGAPGAMGTSLSLAALGIVLVQLLDPIPLWVAALTTAIGLVALTLLLHGHRARSTAHGADFAIAAMVGLTIDAGIQASFGTWGQQWRTGGWAVLVTAMLAILVLATLPGMLSGPEERPEPGDRETRFTSVLPVLALGPFLMLQLSFTQNIAFIDTSYDVPLAAGTAVVLAADAGAIALMLLGLHRRPVVIRLALGVALVACAWLMTGLTGIPGIIVIFCAGVFLGPLLASALAAGGDPDSPAAWRTAAAVGIGTTLFAVLALAFQVDITNPLPVSGRWIPVVAAVIALALAAAPVRSIAPRPPKVLVAVPVALLIVIPMATALRGGTPALAQGNGATLRILDWNVHSMVNAYGMLDPEAIAKMIEAQGADVVTLQEVTRGWLIAGATDEAEWLARRLSMTYAWSPAADSEFGNLLLSRYPIVSADSAPLPYVDGPQHRSFVVAGIDIGGGHVVRVIGAHLESNTARTHRAQVDAVLAYAGTHQPTIIAGDMNMQPTEADAPLFAAAGFRSAQDTTGNGALSSAQYPNFPGDRVDWIFGTRDVAFSDFAIPRSTASDHLPLVATATIS